MALGLLLALGAARWTSSLLYEISPRDPAVYAGSVVLLVFLALVSILFPARRAARNDPMAALRTE